MLTLWKSRIDEQLVNKISQIWKTAKINSPLNQKSAVCISTIDSLGFPQARFVDLKEIGPTGFTFCTSYNSDKGKHLLKNPNVSLVAWWDHIGYQIRVVGTAAPISTKVADKYWLTRSKEAQVATNCFKQSETWSSQASMESHFSKALTESEKSISRPNSWGGFTIEPHSIEILKFKPNRVHAREKYFLEHQSWKMQLLQP
ncbi:pyridoxal 5'-phosphate synthase [Psychrosphaera ytuae]|uniref:Pyridoxal 5'-phosphate synthase n=1 Tax=Psychrosphaera ytuae TaxID=2820710 RepID=A0A975DBP3_9GAMM|nr:pyridoxal 5'-phosphate synthase [Psychrosphaera ytuae]QTH63908.1 pyridoxal 5'-phosphate synthase [Psychrosphaera ytuae]